MSAVDPFLQFLNLQGNGTMEYDGKKESFLSLEDFLGAIMYLSFDVQVQNIYVHIIFYLKQFPQKTNF